MKNKRICVCGHFGFGKNLINGQTVKTKTVCSEIEKICGAENVIKTDTSGGIKFFAKLPFILLSVLSKCGNIVIFPAQRGVRIIIPFIVAENIVFRRRLHYCVIGGWLPEMLKSNPMLLKFLKKLFAIYVETEHMKKELNALGLENAVVMPNFKNLDILEEDGLVRSYEAPFKLCTFSRVMKEKGIDDAVEAVKHINKKYGKTVYTLDIFGPVAPEQAQWFENLKNGFDECISYKGSLPYEESVNTLKNYFALLFPTHYKTEGVAGTLIDALASGVPAIAADCCSDREVVSDNITGLLFEQGSVEALEEKLDFAYNNTAAVNDMKKNCIAEAKKYLPSSVMPVMTDKFYS